MVWYGRCSGAGGWRETWPGEAAKDLEGLLAAAPIMVPGSSIYSVEAPEGAEPPASRLGLPISNPCNWDI